MTREPGFYWVKMEHWEEPEPVRWTGAVWIIYGFRYTKADFTYIDPPENRLIEPKTTTNE